MSTEFKWILAEKKDEALVLRLMKEFYEEDKIDFHEDKICQALSTVFSEPMSGKVFLLKKDTSDEDASGYMVLTYAFYLEFGGRTMIFDELYIGESARGQGLARKALDFAVAQARQEGLHAVRLEVNSHNEKARAIYLKYGFVDEQRGMMKKLL